MRRSLEGEALKHPLEGGADARREGRMAIPQLLQRVRCDSQRALGSSTGPSPFGNY